MYFKPINPKIVTKRAKFDMTIQLTLNKDACWLWNGRKTTTDGYAVFEYKGFAYLASRVQYFFEHRIDPGQMLVCHSCDNPLCCNPRHLFLGTSQDNVKDSVAKGRHSSVTIVGEQKSGSKLTEDQVKEIRFLRLCGQSLGKISHKFKIDPSTVSQIALRKTWKHV